MRLARNENMLRDMTLGEKDIAYGLDMGRIDMSSTSAEVGDISEGNRGDRCRHKGYSGYAVWYGVMKMITRRLIFRPAPGWKFFPTGMITATIALRMIVFPLPVRTENPPADEYVLPPSRGPETSSVMPSGN